MNLRLVPVLAVVALAGCSKIHEQRSLTVAPLGHNTLSITAPVSEQQLTVVVSSDQPVNVWILLEKDIPPGFHVDVDQSMDTYDELRAAADFVLPSHDYAVFTGGGATEIGAPHTQRGRSADRPNQRGRRVP